MGIRIDVELLKRFIKFLRPNESTLCWEWTGCLSKEYGQFRLYGKREAAHRVSWSIFCGTIPDGLDVLHKCDVPCCRNPDHLFLGTQKDNGMDMANKKRSACGENHPMNKATNQMVREIREKYRPRKFSMVRLSQEYNLSVSTVSDIIRRRTHRNVI